MITFEWTFLVFGVWNYISELFAMVASEFEVPKSHLIAFGLCPMYWIMRYLCRRMAP